MRDLVKLKGNLLEKDTGWLVIEKVVDRADFVSLQKLCINFDHCL